MKPLLALLALLAGVWLWRRGRRLEAARQTAHQTTQRGQTGGALPVARCARCGVHVPAGEALAGQRGSYCCASHRRESEGA